jgi:O-antigen/teichoic acid export membrane protein
MIAAPRRRSIAVNVAANLLARVWQAMLQLLLTPITIRLLGPEAYGVVTFSGTLLALLLVLDSAIAPVVGRELNRAREAPDAALRARQLMHSLQAVVLAIAALAALAIAAAAPVIARDWMVARTLEPATLALAVLLIGLSIGAQWPGHFYGSAFVALERQDLHSLLRIIVLSVQAVGNVLLLWLVAPSLTLFLAWLALTSLLATLAQGLLLWRLLPRATGRVRVDAGLLRPHVPFALGNMGIGVLSVVLSYADKLILARFLPLDVVAANGLAWMLALTLGAMTAAPIVSSLLPQFARLAAARDQAGQAVTLHRYTQMIALALMPAAAILGLFGRPLLALWLGLSSPLVAPVAALLPWVLAGMVLNTMMGVPYLLQIAHGWTRLTIVSNLIAAPIFVAACWWGIPRYGAVFGAWAFIALNIVYILLLQAPVAFRRLLPGRYFRWLLRDLLLPGAVAVGVACVGRLLVPMGTPPWRALLAAGATGLVALVATALVLPLARDSLAGLGRRLRRRFLARG